MKNTFGNHITLTLFGESHGSGIGCVLDGLAPGLPVDEEKIRYQLSLRRPYGSISTGRVETDPFVIESGVWNGHTTGTPLCILIPNTDTRSGDYERMKSIARPGHADYTAQMKYHGWQDYRGGGHFSGRLTAALVAAGAILLDALAAKGILIGTHIRQAGGIDDVPFDRPEEQIPMLNRKQFAVIDDARGEQMQAAILAAREAGDSVGGILETVVLGMPAGVGEPWFDSLESLLAHAMYSIPAVKGLEFGSGFALAGMRGSEANDPFRIDGRGQVITAGNHNGGINGGISNGMPICFRTAVKPTPTISIDQETVNFLTEEETILAARGRHDPCIVHRARVVQDSMTALVIADVLCGRFGTDWLVCGAQQERSGGSCSTD